MKPEAKTELEVSQIITVATTLGAEIAAPTGTHIYLALTCTGEENRVCLIGAYQNYKDAQRAVIVRVTEVWRELKFYPWNSNGELIDLYKTQRPNPLAGILNKGTENATYSVEFEKNYLETHSFEDITKWARQSWEDTYDIIRINVSMPIENIQTAELDLKPLF